MDMRSARSTVRTLRRLASAALLVAVVAANACLAPVSMGADSASAVFGDLPAGSLCTPTEQSMGTNVDASKDRDPGVATWVGGNMYIGRKPADTAAWTNGTGPDGSYAVEAEGLTVVNGKLMMKPLKNSWGGAGFRFGIAGFGTQFRPARNSTALVVGGNTGDATLPAWSNVQAWSHSGFLRDNGHIASIAGKSSDLWGATAQGTKSLDKNPANTDASVNWNVTDPMEHVTVKSSDNDADAADDAKNLSESEYYQDYVVEDISAPLAFQTATGTVTQGVSTLDTLTRHKYNYYTEGNDAGSSLQYVFNYNNDRKNGTGRGLAATDSYTNREKLITFTGTNNPTMEVFDLDASMLTDYIGNTRYRGVAFAFTNIADTASVVINVTGDSKDISFHNGWQFWWNGTEISDGYSNFNSMSNDENLKKKSELYAKAAQKILWNFHDTNDLTIYGGIANEGKDKYTEDDPAAAMLGSIIVVGNAESGNSGKNADNTTGNFESHVTTNGRVYTEGDFSMHNPYYAAKFTQQGANDGDSASVIDMDQERHNFPWNGSYTESCAAIAWTKTREDGTSRLAGTTWAVYGTYDDAVNGRNPLLTVKDNDFHDKNGNGGEFTVEGLAPEANYFLKETGADKGFQLNGTIYHVATGKAADKAAKVTQSVTKNAHGALETGTAGMENGNITNKPTEATWSKTDVNGAKLAGSQWKLVGQGAAYCVADDVTVGANGAASPSGTTFKDCPDGATTISDHAAGTDGTGVITVKELPAGSYTLTETKAPAGYQVSKDTYTLVIRDDGTASTITKKDGSALADSTVTDEALPVDVEIPVRKTVTGGSWPKTDGRYVPFRFAITGVTGDSDDAKGWPMLEECKDLANCTIDLAPADHATDPTQAVASFGKLTFADAQLSDKPGSGGDYAKTYTYKIAEVAGSDPFVTYSKAEYRFVITVSRATDESGAHAGIRAHAVLARVRDDDGNAASGNDATVGEWTVTSGDAAAAANAKAAFTNAVSGPVLPATGGVGTVGLTVAGAIAVLVASAGLAAVRRSRR